MSSQLLTVHWVSWTHRPNPERLVFPRHRPCTCTLPRSAVTSRWFSLLTHKPSSDLAYSLHPTGLPWPCFPPSHRAQNLPATQCSPVHSSKQHTSDSQFCLSPESLLSTQAQSNFFFFLITGGVTTSPQTLPWWVTWSESQSPENKLPSPGPRPSHPCPPPACFSGLSASSTGPLSAHYTAGQHGLKRWQCALCVGILQVHSALSSNVGLPW